ncbi:movement protein [Sesamum angolense]|uniref:Movement protein n=1 Tax=Sesamum angolense TaxID=2727404 RepID=A0AAE1T454_9LAMI|nr:movement protein [Sesamum angolense]
MDLQPSQNSHDEGDRLQTSESLSGFFSRMTVSNKTMERIMRQDSNLSPYDGFRIGGIGEFAIPMEFTGNVMEMQLIPKEEILEELSRLREEIAVTMKWIHIGTIEVVIKATFKEGIDSEIHLSIMDRRINNLRDGCLGTMIGNLKEYIEIPRIFKEFAKVMAPDPIRIRIGGVDIIIKDHPVLDRTMSSRIEYSSRMSFSEDRITGYKGKEKDLARVLTPQEIRVDNVKLKCPEGWKEIQVIFDITKNENFFPCDDLYHLQQPVIGRYEGMLEIAGHEFIVAGVTGRENGCMTLGLSFLEDHKPWGRKCNEYFAAYIDSGSGICTAKPGVFPKEARETLPVIAGRDFSQKILILNTGIREAKIMIGGAFGTPWFRVLRREKAFNRIMPINFRSKRGDFDAKLTNPKMQDKRKFGKVLLSFRQQGLIDCDSFYKESEEEIKNLREALVELKTMDISEESILSLENVKRLIQRNFSENPLAWWDRNKIEATLKIKEECKYEYVRYKPIQMNMEDKKDMQIIFKEHISLGLIEPGISAYSSPGFLVRNHGEIKRGILIDEAGIELQEHIVEKIRNFPDVLKDKKQLQSFLGVVNFAGIFIKDLAKYRKDFRPLLKERKCKVEMEEIHTKGSFLTEMEGFEANSVMLRLRHLRENLEELDREFGRLAASPSVMTRELREQGSKPALRVQDSKPVAADSSTACTRPSSDSGETAMDESQGVKTSDDSSQPSTSGVKEGEIILRPMTGTSKTNTNELSSSSSSAWQDQNLKKFENGMSLELWLQFILCHQVFSEISKLPEWISGAVYDSWQNNPHLKRGDILELKFISAAPEMAGKGSHPAFHFIKLQRPDMVAFNRIKATTEAAPLVSAISEDDISTRRAWGLWVCLTEMDKVKYPFKIFSNKVNGSFLLNSMTGKSTEFAESMFEKKRMLIRENKLPATESTRMKACNMLHVGQWHNHVCPCCEKQEKPLFGTKIRVTQKKPEPNRTKEPSICEPSAAVVWLEEVRKTESLEYSVTRRSKKGSLHLESLFGTLPLAHLVGAMAIFQSLESKHYLQLLQH